MDGQYFQHGSGAPTVEVQFLNTADGSNCTTLVFNTAGLAIAYARDDGANVAIALVTKIIGTWASGGFVHRSAGVYPMDLPVAAVLTGAKKLVLTATGLPAGIVMLNCIVPMGADDVSAAAVTDTTIMSTLAGAGGATAREAIADSFLARAIAGGSNAGRIVRDVFRVLRNKVTIAAGTMTVKAEDDTTTAWTAAVTTTVGANPITEIDPA